MILLRNHFGRHFIFGLSTTCYACVNCVNDEICPFKLIILHFLYIYDLLFEHNLEKMRPQYNQVFIFHPFQLKHLLF